MKNLPKVSVIVPVYNREKTIVACLKSILDSEFRNFEVLLIDDGSTDATMALCGNVAAEDNRVRFFRKSNEGVSVARNVGIANALGEWITFVDSDDAILPCHLNVLDKKYEENTDMIMVEHTIGRIENGKVITKENVGSMEVVVAQPVAAAYLFNDFMPFKNPVFPVWNKFFRRNLLKDNNITFDTTMSLGEDQVFLCHYLQYAKGIVHYKMRSYVNVSWPNLCHLGGMVRTPENYLYNQKRNYWALCSIIPIGGGKTEQYAVNYGIDRPITRILYTYTKQKNRRLVSLKALERFTETEIIPYIKSISTSRCKPVSLHVRWIRFLLLKSNAKIAIAYCCFYHFVFALYNWVYCIARKIRQTVK